jgi:hypothetical protein
MQQGDLTAAPVDAPGAVARPGYVWAAARWASTCSTPAGRSTPSAARRRRRPELGNLARARPGRCPARTGHPAAGIDYLRSAALHGSLDEGQLRRVGRIMADVQGGGPVNDFFPEVRKHHSDEVAVLRAHVSTPSTTCGHRTPSRCRGAGHG